MVDAKEVFALSEREEISFKEAYVKLQKAEMILTTLHAQCVGDLIPIIKLLIEKTFD